MMAGVHRFSVFGVLIVLSCIFLAKAEWKVVSPHLATVLLGVAVTDSNTAYVVGDDNGLGPILLQTTNAGGNWTDQIISENSTSAIFLMDVSFSDTKNGFASGMGLLKITGSLYTTDGQDWTDSSSKHISAIFQSVGHTSATDVWQVGTWSELSNLHGNGVQFSNDGGNTFVGQNWNQESNATARYGSFLDLTTGWIAGGDFPTSESNNKARHFNHHLSFDNRRPVLNSVLKKGGVVGNYLATLAQTTDGGASWTTLYNNVGTKKEGFYFNGISFINETHGWVVGEGADQNQTAYAFIWGTTDGGKTWNQQLYVSGGSFIQIRMMSDLSGWAVGGENVGEIDMKGTYWKTTNGQNWTLDTSILETYNLNIGALDFTTAYSVGISLEGLAFVGQYQDL